MDTELADKMMQVAKRDCLPDDHDLVVKAKDFEQAALGYVSEPQTCSVRKFLGCWARAKKAYSQYTGADLL
ncbi:hypothetical protein ERJ77_01615 [Vibrio anguillarum]|uniref:Uncharacterized protein n=1 Tax=Vibrio anguillarum TaxID=55601 RepID=A0AAW4B8N3_VIBAN|nr:hypothetical protein [Vibrio anguillarum]